MPPSVYTYPPKPPPAVPPKRRFAFLRRAKKGDSSKTGNADKNAKGKKTAGADEIKTWEDNWEQGEYPFVRLEGNRATCAICLMDFEEPKRVHIAEGGKEGESEGGTQTDKETKVEQDSRTTPAQEGTREVRVEEVTDEDRLRLEDAGDGPQPLRLLACGHVFHVCSVSFVVHYLY